MTKNNPIDWQAILEIANNDQQLAEDMVEMFAKELPDFIDNIKNAYKKGDIHTLGEITHKMHGSCCYCGATKLKELVKQLEIDAKTQALQPISQLIDDIEIEVKRITEVLDNKI